jgi:hypothetical protein
MRNAFHVSCLRNCAVHLSGMKKLMPNEISEILSLASDMGFRGFGGKCGASAIAINRVLFKNKGVFVIAVNETLWDAKKHFAGHVVVKFENHHWDSDGRPKSQSDIDDWGDLSDDLYYKEIAKEYGLRWTKKQASETVLFELENEAELPFGHEDAEDLCQILSKALNLYCDNKK